MAKIVSVEQMRAIEQAADASGLSYDQMMENAGSAVAHALLDRVPRREGKTVLVLAGTGNNGGDGLVVGRILHDEGFEVVAYLSKERGEKDPHIKALMDRGVLIVNAQDDQRFRVLKLQIAKTDVILDAVLGTGFQLPLTGSAKDLLKTAKAAYEKREQKPYVVSVDCPSGLDCDTGEVAEESLSADLTVTLAAAKPGLFRFPGASMVGELVIGDIGLDARQGELSDVRFHMAMDEDVLSLLPLRPMDSHKGTFGRALLIAGSINYPGAAGLAGHGSYMVGTGLVTLAVPAPIQGFLAPQLPEATWLILPSEMGVIAEDAANVLRDEIAQSEAILLGPGFGTHDTTCAFMSRLFHLQGPGGTARIGFKKDRAEGSEDEVGFPPTVIDADGLKLLTKLEAWQSALPPSTVLTPHPGEMSVLTGLPKEEIQADRVGNALRWAEQWGAVVVLKGAFTVIASPTGEATLIPFANSALAKAGTGDVLAGMIAGYLAQGLDGYEAALVGAYLHAKAGLTAAEHLGSPTSVLASDVVAAIPVVLTDLASGE